VELEDLEASIGYRFRDRSLLSRALTHKSRAFEDHPEHNGRLDDNEQMEFLGDSILGFLVSESLIGSCPDLSEGRLSRLKAYLVSATHLHEVAARLGLGGHLRLGRGEEMSGGRAKRALLANALEALIAALYLDAGLEEVRHFVIRHVVGAFQSGEEIDLLVTDFKGALQERAQSLGLPPPRYATVQEGGPEHKKVFTVEARIGHLWTARAEGASKKGAGQRAAQLVLDQLSQHPKSIH